MPKVVKKQLNAKQQWSRKQAADSWEPKDGGAGNQRQSGGPKNEARVGHAHPDVELFLPSGYSSH